VLVVLLGETLVPVVMARRVGSITVTDEVVDVPVLTPFVLLKPSFRELGLVLDRLVVEVCLTL